MLRLRLESLLSKNFLLGQSGTVFLFDKIEISTHFTHSDHLRHVFYQKYDCIKSFLQDCDINTKDVSFTLYLYVSPTACTLELLFLVLVFNTAGQELSIADSSEHTAIQFSSEIIQINTP